MVLREAADRGGGVVADEAVVGGGVPAGAEGAEVAFDFPAREGEAGGAGGEVCGWGAGFDEVVPAVTAGEEGEVEFGDAHFGGRWMWVWRGFGLVWVGLGCGWGVVGVR